MNKQTGLSKQLVIVKKILSKDDMRKEGLKSPDYADALMMAMAILPQAEAFTGAKSYAYSPQKLSYRPQVYGRKLAHK